TFQAVAEIWQLDHAAIGRLRSPEELNLKTVGYTIHPCLLDGCLQVLSAALAQIDHTDTNKVYLPVAVEQLRFHKITTDQLWVYARLQENRTDRETITGDLLLLDSSGQLVIEIAGLRLQSIENYDNCFYQLEWQAREREYRASDQRLNDSQCTWLI